MLVLRAVASPGSLPQEVYVWQRQWRPALVKSLRGLPSRVAAVQVLAAEVIWKDRRPEVFFCEPDWAVLREVALPVGVVVRIGPYAGPFLSGDAVAEKLREVLRAVLARARAGGVEPVEVQIDFDCAEAKLAGYRVWLEAFREVTGKTPLTFTALPVWLGHPEAFRALTQQADGFVLHVHSLEKPAVPHAPVVICDPQRARKWIEKAATMGKPFRVSLPTYGYEVGYDRAGSFVGLAAEGARRIWPEDTRIETVRADVDAMRTLSIALVSRPPEACAGVIWFRLPVEGDRLNWDLATLAAVMEGRSPEARLRGDVVWSAADAGLAEIFIENTGEREAAFPAKLEVRWPEGVRVLAMDSLAGYAHATGAAAGGANWTMVRAERVPVLRPGRRVCVGWIKFSHENSLHIELPAAATARD